MPAPSGETQEELVLVGAGLAAVVGIEVEALDFGHERVARVGAGALVVECLLGHLVEGVEEVLLVNTVVGDGLLDADEVLELLELRDEVLEDLLDRKSVV